MEKNNQAFDIFLSYFGKLLRMRKTRNTFLAILILIFVTLSAFGCGKAANVGEGYAKAKESEDSPYDEEIKASMELLKQAWLEDYKENSYDRSSPSVVIKDTRIIKVKDSPVDVQTKKAVEHLEGVDYVIEYILFSNYLGDDYPFHVGINENVIVYRDGRMEVSKMSIIKQVIQGYSMTDCSGVIEEIIDLDDAYNGNLF